MKQEREQCGPASLASVLSYYGVPVRPEAVSESTYNKKLKALDNLRRFSKRKNTIMCCVARKINDKHMRNLIDFCHESRDFISSLHLIPLTETWEEGTFETDICTTMEDVEQIIGEAFPEEKVEFVPAGTGHYLERAMTFFGSPRSSTIVG